MDKVQKLTNSEFSSGDRGKGRAVSVATAGGRSGRHAECCSGIRRNAYIGRECENIAHENGEQR
jgi:hypothetical protein